MAQDQSPAVIDATDAEVLSAETVAPVFTERQMVELDTCKVELQRLQRPIAETQEELGYLWLEAGLYLLKARALYPSVSRETDGETGKFIARQTDEPHGFATWYSSPDIGYSRATAYRYMQGARNCGLTAESTLADIIAIKESRRLKGVTPFKFGRNPVQKFLHPVPGEMSPEDVATLSEVQIQAHRDSLAEAWETCGAFLQDEGCEAGSWMWLGKGELEGLCGLLYEVYSQVKKCLRPEILLKERAKRQLKPGSKIAPPPSFDRPKRKRKLRRYWYGYRKPDGGAFVQPFTGDKAALETCKKDHPGVAVVGPFPAPSSRAAKIKLCKG